MSTVYSTDTRTLPIVYDCPVCENITISLLDCPRLSDSLSDLPQKLELGDLINDKVGNLALKGIVGVVCEGKHIQATVIIVMLQHSLNCCRLFRIWMHKF